MCGISGAACLAAPTAIDPAGLHAMREAMVHRGPDSAGTLLFERAGLAMRRLAIIDVDTGQQPLTNEDGRVAVICNGEIYNFRELRASLEQAGHRFRTFSDCEVIVHAYEEYGDEFLTHLNGMFALAVWDDRRQRLLLARDRVGIKPLFYAEHHGLLLFASEPKALLAWPGFPRALDLVALDEYLVYQYVPTPRSMYAGMRKLRPGHVLVVEGGRLVESPYWQLDLSRDARAAHLSEAELAEQLWQTLRQSVQLELASDVPLGVFLSGGIDSSAVVAAMMDLGASDVRTFSIGFDEPSFDESAHARRVATALGTRHSEMILDQRLICDLVPRVAEFLDEPLADASIVPTHLLSAFTRRHVTVALGGDGGDELFAGYSTLQAHRLAGYYARIPAVVRRRAIAPVVRRLPVSHNNLSLDFRAKRFVQDAELPLAVRHHRWLGPCSPTEGRALLHPEVGSQLRGRSATDALDEHVGRAAAFDDLSQVLYLDMKLYLESNILPKVDRASMACSLEVRVPLLNTLMLDLLSEERLRRQALFEPGQVKRLIDEHLQKRRDHRMVLWALIVFQLWHER